MSTKKKEIAITEPEVGNLLHLSGITADGHLWRTIRFESGGWSPFEDVETRAGDIGTVVDVDLQNILYDIHLCAVDSLGRLWHSLRQRAGTWRSFLNIKLEAGNPGNFLKVAVEKLGTARDTELHVCGITDDAKLWYTFRRSDGSWVPFTDVEWTAGEYRYFVQLGLASVGARELHLCAVTSDGHIWHTTRKADGSWNRFVDVESKAGERGTFTDVDCAIVNNQLHVCAVTDDGHLWHTIRRTDGSWQAFADVELQTGKRGEFLRIATAEAFAGELHVAGVTTDFRLWNTTRRANGSWLPFANVESGAGERGDFTALGIHGLSII
jgi:hypothetical protein